MSATETSCAKAKRIRLRSEVMERWMQKKELLGFFHKTHSQFADFLLDFYEDAGGHPSPSKYTNILNSPEYCVDFKFALILLFINTPRTSIHCKCFHLQ